MTSWRKRNGAKLKKYYKQYRLLKREEALDSFIEKKCASCGIEDLRVLQVDHIEGGGWKERKLMGGGSYCTQLPDLIRRNPDKYQLLCANCNWIKKFDNNEIRKCE